CKTLCCGITNSVRWSLARDQLPPSISRRVFATPRSSSSGRSHVCVTTSRINRLDEHFGGHVGLSAGSTDSAAVESGNALRSQSPCVPCVAGQPVSESPQPGASQRRVPVRRSDDVRV